MAGFPPQPFGTGPNFPRFVVACRSKMPDIRRSSLLEGEKNWLPSLPP
jgi:hypothetical protein